MAQLALLVWAIVAVACHSRTEQTLAAVNGLLAVVKQTDSLNQTFPSTEVGQRLAEFANLNATAASTPDSLNFGRALAQLGVISDGLRKCLDRHTAINSECGTTTKQLNALRVDLQNKAINPDSAMVYIDTEFQFVQALNEAVFDLNDKTSQYLTNFDAWHDSLKTVIAP